MKKIEKKIDWEEFDDQYVRLEVGIKKKLRLKNWTAGEWFGRSGISFDVVQEDSVKNPNKQFTVTSRRLIQLLKPILIQAEERGQNKIAVTILRTGEGVNTQYEVEHLPPSVCDIFNKKDR